jgi:hypothetical protein
MNKRIKQLAEQVDKEFNSPYDRYKAIERFAELIIKECGRAADNAPQPVVRFLPYLMQHFGVEE